jgi:peptidoglycan/LPS O-acetylase OafA/YrhL
MAGTSAATEQQSLASVRPLRGQLAWVDLFKAIALAWIFINHVVERVFGAPYLANPTPDWPELSQRLAQLTPLSGDGLGAVLSNVWRYIGWTGDHGVQLFLIVSGFGLTWGLLARYGSGPLAVGEFFRRRFLRLFPLWWGAHIFFAILGLITGWGLSILQPAFYLSMAGVRFTPDRMYYFAPGWWFIGLLIQLYLIFPILWAVLRRWGPLRLLIGASVVALLLRGAGLLLFDSYLDAWSRGAIFVTRLPEFVFGISLAAWMYRDRQRTDRVLRHPLTLLGGLTAIVGGLALALTLVGMTVSYFLIGVGVFEVLYRLFGHVADRRRRSVRAGEWIGRHSYSLYLMHHPWILLLVPIDPQTDRQWVMAAVGTALALLATFISAIVLEKTVDWTTVKIMGWWKRRGIIGVGWRAVATLAVFFAALLGAELLVERLAPQEVYGWGEKPALQPDEVVGWRMKPNVSTQLRWLGYDYRADANSLGFPAPDYAVEKVPNVYRILVTGDAFSSAEGVDTDRSWVRQLEAAVQGQMPDRKVEVLDLAMTGYGPNQYAAVIEQYAPVYQPDVILVEMFVNDFQDALTSNEEFQTAIGFDQPDPFGWSARLRFMHLRNFIQYTLAAPVAEWLTDKPNSLGYVLGNFSALEKKSTEVQAREEQAVADRLAQISRVADQIGARAAIIMVPASVQVCAPEQLAYYPRGIVLSDAARYDIDGPQRVVQQLARQAQVGYYDLRAPLKELASAQCPYVPYNMHWTAVGHSVVANEVAAWLQQNEYLQERIK